MTTLADRRHFLRTSSVCLAMPWLESLARGQEQKAPAVAPRRIVSICTGFGIYGPAFFPELAGTDYQDSEYTATFRDLRDKFTIFSGISHPEIGGDHASEACFLTSAKHPAGNGFRNSISLDMVAAKHLGNTTRFPLLSLCTVDGGTPLTYTASGASIPSLHKPSEIFVRLFLSGNAKNVAAEVARLERGQSIMDRMGDRFESMKRTLSQRDQQQLTEYTEAVRDMEKQLYAGQEWAARPKPVVDMPPPNDQLDRADLVGRIKMILTMAKLALQTDSTRVISIMIRGMDNVPLIDGISEDHHGLTHHGKDPRKIQQLKVIEKAELAAIAEFLRTLRETKESDSTLLDQTQVLVGSNLGDASSHGTSNLPILLAGCGYKHGRHIAGDTKNNTPLGKLFVSMLQRFGVETDKFGSGTGTINGLV